MAVTDPPYLHSFPDISTHCLCAGPLELEVEWAHFSLSSAVEQDAQPPTWHVHAMSPQYRNRRWGRGFGYPVKPAAWVCYKLYLATR